MPPVPDPPLTGYVVVDLSSGIAGAYCTKLLADGGARVVKVEAPQGDPLRCWSASGAGAESGPGAGAESGPGAGAESGPGADGALFSFLACSKHSVVAEPDADGELVDALLAEADAVIWSRGPGMAERPEFAPAEIRNRHPHLTVTAITPFGLEGPWCDRPATEFTLQAWSGGIVGLGRGAPDRAPVYVGGQVGEYLAGAYASAATLASRMRGGAESIDLSMLETAILGLTYYPVSYFEMLGRPWRDARRLTVPGIARAKDGLVDIGCGTAQQWFDLCAMTGHVEWIDEDSPLSITQQANEKADELYAWVADQTVDEIRDLATAFRIPNAPVANGANVETLDHFVQRGSFLVNPRDGFTQPAPPYRMSPATLRPPTPAPRLGEHTEHYRSLSVPRNSIPGRDSSSTTAGNVPRKRVVPPIPRKDSLPLEGLRVVDMTTFWAGPSCTHLLAMLGADVIHVESTRHPDGTRLIAGIPVTEDKWWERSPIFSGLNTNKRGITLNLQSDTGRDLLKKLIATADVVVENFTPRVLESMGLTYDAVRAVKPDVIMARMPGFGLDGPWRDNPAFAYVIEAAAGISWLTGYPDLNPFEPYSVGDPNAGVHALNAILLALEHRRRTGEGSMVEAAMVDAALNVAAEQVIEYSAYGALLQRAGNRGPTAAPQNLYLTNEIDEFGRDDCWVAIAVATDAHWAGLCQALGRPGWAMVDELATAPGRRAHHDLIDRHLAAWCAERTGDQIVTALWDNGVPAAKVMQPHRQTEIPQLASRGFFEYVQHPVNPTTRHSTLPFRSSRGPDRVHTAPAPLLGEHNREVLAELGVTDDELGRLEVDGVIGTAPAR
ncbi:MULTISPECIES: CaiB/BaiF CoA-transferase family protein [Mycolicibacterium]|uniref:L-carnitine dehydratase/bile acid-inducible protein F n=1 Tax=Mycolicibacterium vanbaalenii (strain DSM 7251 / JCM 13017 / BCRC 16820 / KCTC 9966 / NRRL B-24157 / PYR-1) TaxID=350058 RepID=A1TCV6_MYCVP|nr:MULTISPECIES: CoA transferase [Mycolicibacterium]ABM15006.1 L-carnitine dehydratase/bile acid-inducible protein F [Mycolicibacterium vanbaalenii PYR-1]QZY44791.1 CoA transferase [Mycolicibacterium austroafricanum]